MFLLCMNFMNNEKKEERTVKKQDITNLIMLKSIEYITDNCLYVLSITVTPKMRVAVLEMAMF